MTIAALTATVVTLDGLLRSEVEGPTVRGLSSPTLRLKRTKFDFGKPHWKQRSKDIQSSRRQYIRDGKSIKRHQKKKLAVSHWSRASPNRSCWQHRSPKVLHWTRSCHLAPSRKAVSCITMKNRDENDCFSTRYWKVCSKPALNGLHISWDPSSHTHTNISLWIKYILIIYICVCIYVCIYIYI